MSEISRRHEFCSFEHLKHLPRRTSEFIDLLEDSSLFIEEQLVVCLDTLTDDWRKSLKDRFTDLNAVLFDLFGGRLTGRSFSGFDQLRQ